MRPWFGKDDVQRSILIESTAKKYSQGCMRPAARMRQNSSLKLRKHMVAVREGMFLEGHTN